MVRCTDECPVAFCSIDGRWDAGPVDRRTMYDPTFTIIDARNSTMKSVSPSRFFEW